MKLRVLGAILLTLSVLFFTLGLYYPILATKQQVFGLSLRYREVRLFDSVKMFYESKDYFLSSIIFLFTIVLPVIKFLDLFNRILMFIPIPKKINHLLYKLDKWSMLDVFLVALLLLNFKMNSNIIVMKLMNGTTFIALSIIFRMFASELLNSKINKQKRRLK